MRHDHGAVLAVELVLDEPGPVHPEDVLPQTIDEQVALLGRHLTPRKNQEVVPPGQVLDLPVVPEPVVIGNADTIQSDPLGLLDELVSIDEAVNGGRVCVRVDVDYQLGFDGLRLRGR